MWFDAFAKLVEIVAPPCDIRDNCDTGRQFSNCCDVSVITVSRMSQVSQRPPARKSEPKPSAKAFRHGVSFAGKPLTWTGHIVSLDDWRRLTEWEQHGPNGRHWNSITQTWEEPE
ncbi:hypothetical protein ROE7235_02625 [Roseibaca ekhonensis]|uniref:Uncharacterized protein n=1 Tax=Roseinatronobacter ekhonensis TaxID=254356 RepID=A0A3B0MAG9_9RHOB|nr:hypothetical protein [Roseibaca ekhonensis]SUZ32862.1 hypothetical protein ROE7235_02625 [Roseibaca ekhonensis]